MLFRSKKFNGDTKNFLHWRELLKLMTGIEILSINETGKSYKLYNHDIQSTENEIIATFAKCDYTLRYKNLYSGIRI